MCRKLTLFVYWAVATALLAAIPTFGQTTNGLITGVVTDPSGAVVTEAHVELLNATTGVQRETATDSNGQYIVPQLPPGIYDISVSKQGFATVKRSAVQPTYASDAGSGASCTGRSARIFHGSAGSGFGQSVGEWPETPAGQLHNGWRSKQCTVYKHICY